MAKVFRLFSDKDLEHWQDRGNDYGTSVIEKIPNPDGDFSSREPTSIPSPFARIDLVRTAFNYIVEKEQLDGDTIYHKIVSDCLDVAEMFFKIDSLGSKIQIRSWNKNVDLQTLLDSKNPKHKLFGETLKLFLTQDKRTYNFDLVDKLFFIFYEHRIIGGTSPSTMFFTSGNDLGFANIKFGNDILFDRDLKPLYRRDPEFQKYMYHFFRANPDARNMKDFFGYLEKSLDKHFQSSNKILEQLYKDIKKYDNENIETIVKDFEDSYDSLDTGTDNDFVNVIGFRLRKKKQKERKKTIAENSDFVIKATKTPLQYPPLVLQSKFSEHLVYTDKSVKWDGTIEVPFFDAITDLNKRKLPDQLDEYPYLTVSDFLEPYLIRLPYPINESKYFDGHIEIDTGEKGKSYLLPLTKRFFDFFNTDDLLSQEPDMPTISITVYAGEVDVVLKVPIKLGSHFITFKRTYENKRDINSGKPDLENNKGIVIENQIGLSIFPDIRIDDLIKSPYRVLFIDRDLKHINFNLSFFSNNENKEIETVTSTRSNKESDLVSTKYFMLAKQFDYIQISQHGVNGILIPKLRKCIQGTDTFKFAIDFGTTNTHIEYKINNARVSKPFEITAEDIQIANLHNSKFDESDPLSSNAMRLISEVIPHEFLPENIGKEYEFRFPQRTALSHHRHLKPTTSTYALSDYNISFIYEKQSKKSNSTIFTNLKWSNYTMEDEDRIRVEKFFEQIIFIIRNKVLINGGNLDNVEITWFYPSSMSTRRRGGLEKAWRTQFAEYISTQNIDIKLTKISESVAPFFYFKENLGVDAAHHPVAAIDIGGGTTDIVIYRNNEPEALTSFRFAANSIFGGLFDLNGFVKKYLPIISQKLEENKAHLESKRQQLKANKLNELVSILNEIKAEKKSEDIIAFFFAIENNKLIQEEKIPISFNQILTNDDEFKIVFIVFYSAIIYHLAKLMKAKGMEPPRHITFSGTGSKIISIADESVNLTSLQLLTKLIFEKIFDKPIEKIKLWQHSEPKEITCKGGLLNDKKIDIEHIKTVLLGDTSSTLIPDTNLNYSQVSNDTVLFNIIEEVNNFIDLLFSLDGELNFTDKFGVKSALLSQYKSVLKEDLITKLKSELIRKTNELEKGTEIQVEEPLFFYPLAAALTNLSNEIVNQFKS